MKTQRTFLIFAIFVLSSTLVGITWATADSAAAAVQARRTSQLTMPGAANNPTGRAPILPIDAEDNAFAQDNPPTRVPVFPPILLVDDDDNTPNVVLSYTQVLDMLGYDYTTWNTANSTNEPSLAVLNNYSVVIWFTGDTFSTTRGTGLAGPEASTEASLASWLDNGGCLFISSQDYAWDKTTTDNSPTLLMQNYLGALGAMESGTSPTATITVTGTNSYDGLGPYTTSFFFSNASDVFTPTSEANIAFYGDILTSTGGLLANQWGQGKAAPLSPSAPAASVPAAVGLENTNGVYKTTWLGFPLEAIPSLTDRMQILERFLNACFQNDLEIQKTASSNTVVLGDLLTYTLVISNNGSYRATNLNIIDFVPNDATLLSFSSSFTIAQGTCNSLTGNNVSCNLLELKAGASEMITITVSPVQTGTLTNFAIVSINGEDPNPANNAVSERTLVLPPNFTRPVITAVVPDQAANTVSTSVKIEGVNFDPGAIVLFGTTTMSNVIFVSATQLDVTVPPGLPTGRYPVEVINPNGEQDVFWSGFTSFDPNGLRVDSVFPSSAPNDRPAAIDIFGADFSPDMTAGLKSSISGTLIPLENVVFISPQHIRATVPFSITPGMYDLTVTNTSEISATLPNAYKIVNGMNMDDMFMLNYDLWLLPANVRAGETVSVGLTIRRRTGSMSPMANIAASMDIGLVISGGGAGPGTVMSVTTTISPNSALSVTFPWTVGAPGNYDLAVSLSPMSGFGDTNPANNTVTRTVLALPPTGDTIPPMIVDFTLNNGEVTTNQPDISLRLNATDTGGSGLARVLYLEYIFDRNIGDWVPAANSGWLPYQPDTTNFQWMLLPAPGAHYLQVWVVDRAGNISSPATQLINFTPPTSSIAHDEGQVYRLPLTAGDIIQIDLTSLSGDANLFVWGPGGNLITAASSALPIEQATFVAPTDGTYQLDIYGREAATYWLEITPLNVLTPVDIEAVEGHLKGTDRPLLVPGNDPSTDVGIPTPPIDVFLPVIVQ